jgi:hypothetical protein
MRFRIVVVAAVAAGASFAARAEPAALVGEALRSAVSGRTVMLSTPLGGLPISYAANGTMTGQAGQLASYVGSASDHGAWWVTRDKLCQRWDKWLDGKSYCFSLRKDGSTVHWTRNDGQSGVATISR